MVVLPRICHAPTRAADPRGVVAVGCGAGPAPGVKRCEPSVPLHMVDGMEATRPRARLLVTDLDNTLYDWFDIWHSSFSALLEEVARISGLPI